ncbi:MAG: hypothetical protein WDZ35_06810 [Crocinitomicaceae bacterium]
MAGINSRAQSGNGNFNKPEWDLSKDALDQKDLEAYQRRASEKVKEYYQQLEIMANEEHKSAVRDKAMEMAVKEFEAGSQIYLNGKAEKITDYLKEYRKGTTYKTLNSIEVLQGFVPSEEGFYLCKFKVKYSLLNSKNKDAVSTEKSEVISVKLLRKEKNFGSTKKLIWELYLSEIRE